jgi:hypothetical protein
MPSARLFRQLAPRYRVQIGDAGEVGIDLALVDPFLEDGACVTPKPDFDKMDAGYLQELRLAFFSFLNE